MDEFVDKPMVKPLIGIPRKMCPPLLAIVITEGRAFYESYFTFFAITIGKVRFHIPTLWGWAYIFGVSKQYLAIRNKLVNKVLYFIWKLKKGG